MCFLVFQPDDNDDDDDDPALLNPLGLILFWTQFGLGLGLFISLAITIGLLIWCKGKKSPPRASPGQEQANVEAANPDVNGQESTLNSNPRPTISGPINNFNPASDEAEASSSSESIYNEAIDDYTEPYSRNPFQGWSSSFRPVGPPPPPPPESIPMVHKPVAKKDQATMTVEADCPKQQKASKAARSGIQSGYMASPETSLERVVVALPKHRGNSLNRSQVPYEGPVYDLPALPQRSSSLRRKKRGGRRKTAANAATMS